MNRKCLIVLTVVAVVCLVFAACYIENDPTKVGEVHEPYGTITDTKTGTGKGYQGDVTVKVELVAGIIKNVEITLPESDAGSFGKPIPGMVKPLIIKANSFEIDALASVSPAKDTRRGIKQAGLDALSQAGYTPAN